MIYVKDESISAAALKTTFMVDTLIEHSSRPISALEIAKLRLVTRQKILQ